MYLKAISIIILFHFASVCIFGQQSIKVQTVNSIPAIDGYVDDISSRMESFNFYQLEPVNGEPSPSETRLITLQSADTLYMAFACFQDSRISARIQIRDKLAESDDGIFIILGTFNDNRNAFGFGLNPLATQSDFRISDDGRSLDYNWDAEWICAARIYEWGWTAEIAIPFKSLKYRKGSNNWQVNFRRVNREQSEIAYWNVPVREEFKVSLSGQMENINPNVTRNSFLIIPFGMGQLSESGSEYDFDYRAGGDIKWQLNSNLTTNVTVNPDFATVEADEDVIDLTRYEIAYPEKRVFFQEGNEMFGTRMRNFYSRRIGDISAAGKITGKIGKNNINLIQAFEKNPEDTMRNKPFYTVLRIKRDVLKSSSLGFTATNKQIENVSKSSLSADYVLNIGMLWKLTGQYVAVIDDWNSIRSAGYARFAAENNFFHWHIRYSYIDDDGFKELFNESGYINDDNRNEYDSDLSYKWWINSNVLKYINFTSANNVYWNHDYSKFMSWNINESTQVYFTNKFNLDLLYNNEYRFIIRENTGYHNYFYSINAGYNTEAYNSANLRFRTGRSFGSHYYSIESGIRSKVSERVSFELKPRYIKFSPEQPSFRSAFINSLSLTLNFTNDLWIKFIGQTNSANDKVYVYGLAGWRFKPPFGNLYVIINHNEFLDSPTTYQKRNIAYLKLTYPISF